MKVKGGLAACTSRQIPWHKGISSDVQKKSGMRHGDGGIHHMDDEFIASRALIRRSR
jgi:hypothetical protein